MLSINTNISSLIAQTSMKQSTNRLNQAIERMTTGFKINHAKDNAANYSIATNMTTKIGAYNVAEDNAAMGLDLIATAEGTLSQIEDKLQRLRALAEQASNGTYGEQSLNAINAEANALVDEINRIYESAEYNGITLFMESKQQADGTMAVVREYDAKLSTTFKEIGVSSTHFEVYDSDDNLIQAYDLEEDDSIQDFFDTLQIHGFTSRLFNGEMTIKSLDKYYISGDLADELGITTADDIKVTSTKLTETIWTTTTTETTKTNVTNNTIVSETTVFKTLTNIATATMLCSEPLFVTTDSGELTTVTEDTTLAELGVTDKVWIYYRVAGMMQETLEFTSQQTLKDVLGKASSLNDANVSSIKLEDGSLYFYSRGVFIDIDEIDGTNSTSLFSYIPVALINNGDTYKTIEAIVELSTTCIESTETITILTTTTSSTTNTTTLWSTSTVSTTQTMVRQSYNSIMDGVFAPGTISLQVGTDANSQSNINVKISFDLDDISEFRGIGIDNENYLELLDALLNRLSSKQVEFGAVQNRLESVLEEITIQRDNLISSRSTIRDADIAEVSSTYIQQQILQQASATLLATANQSPSIALQLI